MALNSVWIYCLLALCSWSIAMGCNWMKTGDKGSRSNFKVVSYHSISVLQDMDKDVTQGKDDRLPFPHTVYKKAAQLKAEERIVFIYETINDIKKLFISGTRDQKKLETFLLVLDRQASELHQCIQSQKPKTSHSTRTLTMKMRKYFERLHKHLESQKYNITESWEAVRTLVLDHLLRLDLLASSNTHNSSFS